MSATNATLIGDPGDRTESSGSIALTVALLLLFVAWMTHSFEQWKDTWAIAWPSLLFWVSVVLIIDFFPVKVGALSLTLDVPVLLAVAVLYTPEVAASVACVAALDIREVSGRVHLSRAVFNRAQIALSVLTAGYVLHSFGADVTRVHSLILPTLLALFADYAVNATLVTAVRIVDGSASGSFMRELRRLKVGSWGEFLATYLAYGLLAVLFARLYVDAGGWPVAILLASAMAVRQSLSRTRQLERMGQDLAKHQQLLLRALDQVAEERRDERLLIGGQLHDDVLQSIIRARMAVGTLVREWSRNTVPNQGFKVEELQEIDLATQAAHDELRQVIRGLRESPVGPRGLLAALASLARELRQDWRAAIEVDLPPVMSIPGEHQVALYQAAREGIVNALKHGKPTRVNLHLQEQGGIVTLEISDDGAGFSPSEAVGDRDQHFGLALLKERIAGLGGSVLIESQKGRGTKVLIRIRLPES